MSSCYALLLTILVLSGCAGATIEELEDQLKICKRETGDCADLSKQLDRKLDRFYREMDNKRRWRLCQAIYRASGVPMISRHRHDKYRPHGPMEVNFDLMDNNCRMILKQQDMW